MKVMDTPLEGLKVVLSAPNYDHRGAFTRLFCANELHPLLGNQQIAQVNHSKTNRRGAVRGLHFQRAPFTEIKMIRCLKGRVWDVAVDLRANSPTFLNWHAQELAQDDPKMLFIPQGFAHGFQALEPDSELLYIHTEFYNPAAEGGIRHDDPGLRITWPLPPVDLSSRDMGHPLIADDFEGL